MTEMIENNFDWLHNVPAKTDIAQALIDCCISIKPQWTPELDAAARIILFAANGGLARRKYNEMYLRKINTLLERGDLCNSDVIDIATEIIDDGFFYPQANVGITINEKHFSIVRGFSAQWHKKSWTQ